MKKIAILIIVALAFSCAPQQNVEDQEESRAVTKTPVYVEAVKHEKFQHFIQVSGSVEAEQNAMISPEINGQIRIIHIKEGDDVKKGQLLVSLNTSVTESNIAEVKTGLELAKKIFDKQQELWNQNIGSEIQYLEAKNAKESAENRLKTLQAQLEMARIKAPFTGVVEEIFSKVGELASPGFQLLHLVNLSSIIIEAAVSETYISSLEVGDSVHLEFPSFPDLKIKAPIARLGNVINPQSRTFKIEVKLQNPEKQLKPNILTRVKINDFSSDNAIVIPAIIIKQDVNGSYIYIAQAESDKIIARKRYIEEGPTYEDQTMILSGLESEDQVIITGYDQVNNGIPVEIK